MSSLLHAAQEVVRRARVVRVRNRHAVLLVAAAGVHVITARGLPIPARARASLLIGADHFAHFLALNAERKRCSAGALQVGRLLRRLDGTHRSDEKTVLDGHSVEVSLTNDQPRWSR